MCGQTCTQTPNASHGLSSGVASSTSIDCDKNDLLGHWMMITGKGSFTNDVGETVTAPIEKYEKCKIYWTFMEDNKYRQVDQFTDGDTMDYMGRYEWLDSGCQFKYGRWSKKLNDYAYRKAIIQSLDNENMQIKIESPPGGLLAEFVFYGEFQKMPTAFPYLENHCPGYPLVGRWRLSSGTINDGTKQGSIREALRKLGTSSLVYEFYDSGQLKFIQEKTNGTSNAQNNTYSRPGKYNRDNLILTDKNGHSDEFKIVTLDSEKLRFQGNMDGSFINWTFTRE